MHVGVSDRKTDDVENYWMVETNMNASEMLDPERGGAVPEVALVRAHG